MGRMTQTVPKKGLPWWAILLLVCGILALLGGLAIGGAVWWFAANKDRIIADGKQSVTGAQQFAMQHDQNACVGEALRKVEACSGIMCEAQTKVFAGTCISMARPTPGFCTNVPASNEILKTSTWVVAECGRRGKPNDQRCTRLVQAVPEACHKGN